MAKRQIIIFNVHSVSKRLIRFQEELEDKNLEVKIINSYSPIVTDKGLIYQGQEINIQEGDIVWFVANPMINHYLAEYLYQKFGNKIAIWPNSEAVALSDKFLASSFFSKIGIPTPKTVLLNTAKEEKMDNLMDYVGGFPCVIKNCKGSMGKNVGMVNSKEEITDFVKQSFAAKYLVPFTKKSFLLQEFIEESSGTDFRALCLNGEVLGAIKRTAQNGDFKANVSLGGKAEIIEVDSEMRAMAEKIMQEGNIFYAGIDFIKSERGYLALEINTSAQFKGFEKATGINVARKIIEALIEQ